MMNVETEPTSHVLSNGEPIDIEFIPDYVLVLTTPIEFRNIISINVLLFDVANIDLYNYVCTICIDKKGDISINRSCGCSDKIVIVADYQDSISDYMNIIKEIYSHKLRAPYFTLPSLSKVINDKIIKILELPIRVNDKFVRCNYNSTSEYAAELISRLVVKYCKENYNDESHNENV